MKKEHIHKYRHYCLRYEKMIAAGKTEREMAEHYGFSSKAVMKQLLKREWKKLQNSRCSGVP